MDLIVYELFSEIVQEIQTKSYPVFVEALRPHLYKHLNAAGSVKMEIWDEFDSPMFESETITIQSIHDASGPYYHGAVRFYIDASLQPDTKYKLVLKSVGYTFNESAYIGWVNGYDLGVVENSYTPLGDSDKGLICEMWERKKLSKGIN